MIVIFRVSPSLLVRSVPVIQLLPFRRSFYHFIVQFANFVTVESASWIIFLVCRALRLFDLCAALLD